MAERSARRWGPLLIALAISVPLLTASATAATGSTQIGVANARPFLDDARYYDAAPTLRSGECPDPGARDAPPRGVRRAFVCVQGRDANGARDVCAPPSNADARGARIEYSDGKSAPLACSGAGARFALVAGFDPARAPIVAWVRDGGGAVATVRLGAGVAVVGA